MEGVDMLSGTRERILELLWREPRTVDELAGQLGLSGNAVRAHLSGLEAEGFVRKQGLRRGPRKPSVVYACTPEAERLLRKPYAAVLSGLLAELSESVAVGDMQATLRGVGERLAAQYRGRFAGLNADARVRQLAVLLRELGGVAEVEESGNGGYRIRGYSCPLQGVVNEHHEACTIIHALIGVLLDEASVRQVCRHEGKGRCLFAVAFARDSEG